MYLQQATVFIIFVILLDKHVSYKPHVLNKLTFAIRQVQATKVVDNVQ